MTPSGLQNGALGADRFPCMPALARTQSRAPRPRPRTATPYEWKSWWLLGLALLIIVALSCTIPSLYVGLIRSGYLGDHVPASGEAVLLTGLIGLTVLFCLYMVHQQAELNALRRRMHYDTMELEQARGRLAELTSLFQLGGTLQMNLPLETVSEITVRRVASSLHSYDASLFLLDPDGRRLVPRASFGLTARGPESEVLVGEGAVGWAARAREPILMKATDREARFAAFFTQHPDAGSVLILPVCVEKRCIAVLQVCRASCADPFRIEHRDVGQLFADNVAPVIDRAQAQLKLREAAAAAGAVTPPAEEVASGAFRDVFLTAAATELKSPLTSLVAYTEVFDQNDPAMTPATRREFTARLYEEAQRMLGLVDDVLDLVRLELGRYLLDVRMGSVNQTVRAARDLVAPLAEGRSVALDLDLEGSIPDQHFDPAKIRQSLVHILRHAIRFSPQRSRVRLRSILDREGVLIEVKDSGPTIPAEASEAMFNLESVGGQFGKRFKERQGFGLHLARRFVELHGGRVGAGPAPDGGAVIWIRLPRGEDLSSLLGSAPFAEDFTRS
jgi:signal transduction histidine kinase